MATRSELMQMAQRAKDAQQPEKARALVQMAMKAARQEQAVAKQQEGSAIDTFSDFGRGITAGAVKVSHIGQKLLWKGAGALGMDGADDLLNIVNRKQLDAVKKNEEYKRRSPTAYGLGEGVGETLMTLPIGGAGAVGGKVAFNAARMGINGIRAIAPTTAGLMADGALATGSALAGEGAAVGAYLADGKDVGTNALVGAGVGMVGGYAVENITKAGGVMARDWFRGKQLPGAVAGELEGAAARIQRAADDGGYDMRTTTALANSRGKNAEDMLRQDQQINQRFLEDDVAANTGIENKALEIAGQYGPTTDRTMFERAHVVVQDALSAMRKGSENAYREAYRKFDALAAQSNTKLPTDKLSADLEAFVADNVTSADSSLAGKIGDDLERFGIRPKQFPTATVRTSGGVVPGSAPDTDWLGGGTPKRPDPYNTQPPPNAKDLLTPPSSRRVEMENPTNSPYTPYDKSMDAPKQLTLENAEDLIQALNKHYSPTMNAGEKQLIAKVKELVEKHIDDSLDTIGNNSGVGAAVRTMGQEARAARRAFSEDWTSDDIIKNITERTKAGDDYAVHYSKALAEISGDDGVKHINTIKARLMLNPDGQKALESMKQAPIMEAFAEATRDASEKTLEGGVVKFNAFAFEKSLNRTLKTREAKVALYGEDGVVKIEKAIAAWKDKYRRPDTSGSTNPSGTAMTLLKQLRFLPSGSSRNIGMFMAGFSDNLSRTLTKGRRHMDTTDILEGKSVPQSVKDDMGMDFLDEWERDFVGADGLKYGNVLRHLLRNNLTVVNTD